MSNVLSFGGDSDVVLELMKLVHQVRTGEVVGVTVVKTLASGEVSMQVLSTPLSSSSVVAA